MATRVEVAGLSAGKIIGACVRLRRWWMLRRDVRALEALDDRTLKDIGVYRGNIRSIVSGRNSGMSQSP